MPLSRLLIFIGIVSTVLFLVHYYVWRKVIHAAALPQPWARILTIALFSLAALIPVMFLTLRNSPNWFAVPLTWVTYVWMGFLFYLFVFSLVGDLLRLSGWATGLTPRDPERRGFLLRALAGGIASAALLVGAGGILHAARGPKVKRVRVPLAKLPEAGGGYVIAQLTDVHIGPTLGRDFLETVVRDTNALSPDLIVITGDLVDGSVDQLREKIAPLAELRARDGVFFVTGNHEYYSGADEWIAHIATMGIRTLRNEHVVIRDLFTLAGVDDRSADDRMAPGHGQDVPGAVAGHDPSLPLLLLAHQPKAIDEAVAGGVDLQLSGHVHGGQIVPFNWLAKLEQPYLSGLYRNGNTWIYVSPGTGYWGPPMRVGTTSEITRIELVAGEA